MLRTEGAGYGVHEGEHADHALTRQERHTQCGLRATSIQRVVGAPQPALVHARVWDEGGLAVPDDPAGQAAVDGFAKLAGSVLVQARAVYDSGIDGLASVIQHDDAAPLAADVLHGSEDEPLQHGPQVQGSRYLAVNLNEEL